MSGAPRVGDVYCFERGAHVLIAAVVDVACDGSVDFAVAYCPGPAPFVQTATAGQWRGILGGTAPDGEPHTVTMLRRGAEGAR